VIRSVFRTQKDAPRFALFEVGGDNTLFVSLPQIAPRSTKPRRRPSSMDRRCFGNLPARPGLDIGRHP
jgi:hypothetical protein